METKKKKRILNILMVIMVIIIAGCGVLAVGNLKGWFGDSKETQIYSKSILGIVNIERNGIGYALNKETALKEKDLIETRQGSSVELQIREDQTMVMNQNTELTIRTASKRELVLGLDGGEILADTAQISSGMSVLFGGINGFTEMKAEAESAVFSIDVQSGSAQVNVYKGTVVVTGGTDAKQTINEKESLLIADGNMTKKELQIEELNEFLIDQLPKCHSTNQIVFASEELQQVLEDREAQKQAALEESLKSGIYIAKKTSEETEEGADSNPQVTNIPESQEDNYEVSVTEWGDDESYSDDYEDVSENVDENNDSDYEEYSETDNSSISTCTIQIVCDTILDNMENLTAGKEAYVPASGVILSTSTVEFSEGETVFDVLTRVCSVAGIQIEYSWTPMYNSYYIEGINNLYEFDCGNESGWMYKVNGWFPNYGCSSYTLEDGDVIVWCYTCNGLGADVGGGM